MKKILLGIFLLALLAQPSLAAIYQKVPGSALWMSVPRQFQLSDRFSGFIDQNSGGSISVVALPGKLNATSSQLLNDQERFLTAMKQYGFEIENKEDIIGETGLKLRVFSGKQSLEGKVFNKWATWLSNADTSYIITIQMPQSTQFGSQAALNIFKQLRMDNRSNLHEELSTLPFSFQAIAPFHAVNTAANNALLLSAQLDNGDKVSIVITKSLESFGALTTSQILDNYLQSLRTYLTVEDIEVKQSFAMAGREGIKIVARAKVDGSLETVALYGVKLANGQAIIMHVSGPPSGLDKLQTQIDGIAQSIALKR